MSLAIFDFVNFLICPKRCLFCNYLGTYLCDSCTRKYLKVNFQNICHVCGNYSHSSNLHKECEDSTNLYKLYFFCEYNKHAKDIIENIKYKEHFSIIEDISVKMAKYLLFKLKDENLSKWIVTSVPSFYQKENSRGFNQSKLLAQKVAQLTGLKYQDLLIKNKSTQKQAGTTKSSRQFNLRNIFKAKTDIVTPNVMIIDDVHTTGSTLNECAGVLIKSGARRVYGYTFSKSLNYGKNSAGSV